MSELSKLPNIGKVLAERLEAVGITTAKELREVGSIDAFIRLKAYDPTYCMNSLYAIEGAVQNMRWHHLDKDSKEKLKDFYNNHWS